MNHQHIQISYEIDDVLGGKKPVSSVSQSAQEWLSIMAHNIALGIADLPREKRASNAEYMKANQPLIADMALPLARAIIEDRLNADEPHPEPAVATS